jgi:hypothetical protein
MTPARAVEVAAVFEDSVIHVKHLTEPRPPEANERITHILLGGGALALLGALGTFIASVHQISVMRRAHDAAVAARQASGPFVLPSGGQWLDFVVTLCLVAGTWGILHGLGRLLAARRSRDFVIGPSTKADVAVPLAEDRALVKATADGWLFNDAPITQETRELVEYGPLRFIVAGTDAPARLPNALNINWIQEAYIGGVALAAGVFLGLLYMIPPDPKTLALDTIHSDFVAHYIIKAPELPEMQIEKKSGPVGGGGGAAHEGAAGSTGRKDAPRQHAAFKIKGNSPDQQRIGKLEAQRVASQTGIVGIMGQFEQSHIGSIFARESALGNDAEDAFGDMRATVPGDSYGTGLDLLGTGPGGGGHSTDTIGFTGSLRAIGPGGPGRPNGYPPGHAVALRPKTEAKIDILGKPDVKTKGGLSKEIIQRVIHYHAKEIKFCYDRRLMVKSNLQGRVLTAFVISSKGVVLSSNIQASTTNDSELDGCIAQAVRRWEFPKPEDNSITSVVYPFVLHAPAN